MVQFRKVELILTEHEAEMLEKQWRKGKERHGPDLSLDVIVSSLVGQALYERSERADRLAAITQ